MRKFIRLLIREYNKQIIPFQDYDDNLKCKPCSIALLPRGMLIQYPRYVYAEGYPQMLIEPKIFIKFLKQEDKRIEDLM